MSGIYQQHFGLARPFSTDGMVQGASIFRSDATESLLSDLGVAMSRKDSVAILHGPSGTGKSTLAHDTLKELSTCLAFAAISQRPETPHELLEQILCDFGYEVFDKSHVERRQIWRQFICEAATTDTRVCLLIEDAESLDTAVMKSLHQLTAADALLSPGCNLILTTTEPPGALLTDPELASFNQRVRLRRSIEPLTETEVEEYLAFKCELAGVRREDLLAPDVAQVLSELSGGIIRVIDNLLESSLASAAARNASQVTSAGILQIAETQFGLRQLQPTEIDSLLSEPEEMSATPAFIPADIPTLTECVRLPTANMRKAGNQAMR